MSVLYVVNIVLVFCLCVYLIYHFKLTNNDYENDILKQKDVIEEQHNHIKASIAYASRLQEAILPPLKQIHKSLPESFVYFKPKDVVAGDFYWHDTIGDEIYISVADCTGHGVPGAMVSMICSNALNKAVKELKISEPGKILDKVRAIVVETFEKSEEEVRDGMDIAFCRINIKTKKLSYAGANNPLYRITVQENNLDQKILNLRGHMLLEYKGDKQPIGNYAKEEPFTQIDIQLSDGDTIYMSSDGYPDQFGGDKGRKYMYKPFKNLFLDIHHKEMEMQKELLHEEFTKWKGQHEQVDDVCVIGVRV